MSADSIHTWFDATPASILLLTLTASPSSPPSSIVSPSESTITTPLHASSSSSSARTAASSSSSSPISIPFSSLSCAYANIHARHTFGELSGEQQLTSRVHPDDRSTILCVTSPTQQQSVKNAYTHTEYRVKQMEKKNNATGPSSTSSSSSSSFIAARIHRLNGEIDSLLQSHFTVSGTFITAYNPRSRQCTDEWNRAAHMELKRAIQSRGSLPSESGEDEWRESGFFVFGWTRDEARACAQQFGQNAIVYCELGKPAELIWAVPDLPNTFTVDVRISSSELTSYASLIATSPSSSSLSLLPIPTYQLVRITANPAPPNEETIMHYQQEYVCTIQPIDLQTSMHGPSTHSSSSVSITHLADGTLADSPFALSPTHQRQFSSEPTPPSDDSNHGDDPETEMSVSIAPDEHTDYASEYSAAPSPTARSAPSDAGNFSSSSRQRLEVSRKKSARGHSPSFDTLAPPIIQAAVSHTHSPLLRASEELTSTLLRDSWRSIPVMFATILNQRFVLVGVRFCQLSGYTEEELLCMRITDIMHPADCGLFTLDSFRANTESYNPNGVAPDTSEARDALEKTFDPIFMARLKHKSGAYMACMFRSSVSDDMFESVDSLTGSGTSGESHPVEPYVHLMARPMYNQERRALSTALEAIQHQKAEFISNISHELLTPMNGIVASSEMLSQTELSAEQIDYINCISISAEHMNTIISDILQFARVDQGRLRLSHSSVHLTAVLEEAITLCFRPKSHDHLEIVHSIADDLPIIVLGDPARIRQILVHQLSNALKFTRAGYIQIRVTRYDESESPAALLQQQTERLQRLHQQVASGALIGEELKIAEEELAAPQMLIIQPPSDLPSLFQSTDTNSQGIPIIDSSLSSTSSTSNHSPAQPPRALTDTIVQGTLANSPRTHNRQSTEALPTISVATSDGSTPQPQPSRPPSAIPPRTIMLQFAIEDSGIGIDARHSTKLFQIFSQADASSMKEHAGTGIGLLTSLKLVRHMHGDMWIRSVPGRGSTFFFTIAVEPSGPVTRTPLNQSVSIASSISSTPLPHATNLLHPFTPPLSANGPPSMIRTVSTPLERVRSMFDRSLGVSGHHSISSTGDLPHHNGRTASISSSSSEHDSPISNVSPHRSPLIFPRFQANFQRVGVVDANSIVCETIATDLRSRGAAVRTFTSCATALAFAESTTQSMDCWIIDSVSGTTNLKASSFAAHINEAICAPGEISGTALVDQLLQLRSRREKQKSQIATTSVLTPEPDLKVVLLVQSFGLPPALSLSDTILQSQFVKLIQVHKPYKHQILYDAIRALADQLQLPAGVTSTPSLTTSSAASNGLTLQGRSRRTLTLSMPMGDRGSSGSVINTNRPRSRKMILNRTKKSDTGSGEPTPLQSTKELSYNNTYPALNSLYLNTSNSSSHQLMPPSPYMAATTVSIRSSRSDGTAGLPMSLVPSPSITPSISPAPRSTSPMPPKPILTPVSTTRTTNPSETIVSFSERLLNPSSRSSLPLGSSVSHRSKAHVKQPVAIAKKYPLTILVVEDNVVNMKIVLKVLGKLGYSSPDTAVDGAEGFRKVCEKAQETGKTYDIVLLDLQMPICDGFECASHIMQEFGCCNLAIPGSKCIHHTSESITDAWFRPLLGNHTSVSSFLQTPAHLPSSSASASPYSLRRTVAPPQLAAQAPPPTASTCPRPIIIAVTANTTEEDRLRCLRGKFDEFICKPISIADLSVPLKKWGKKLLEVNQKHMTVPTATLIQASLVPVSLNGSSWSGVVENSDLLPSTPITDTPIRQFPDTAPRRPSLRAMTSLDTLRTFDSSVHSSNDSSTHSSPKSAIMIPVVSPLPISANSTPEPPTATSSATTTTSAVESSPDPALIASLLPSPQSSQLPPPPHPRLHSSLMQRSPGASSRLASRQLAHSSRVVASQKSPLLRARTFITTTDHSNANMTHLTPDESIGLPRIASTPTIRPESVENIYSHGAFGQPASARTPTRVTTSPPMSASDTPTSSLTPELTARGINTTG